MTCLGTKVITAIFLRETLAVANNDTETMIAEKMRAKSKYTQHLTEVTL